MKTKLTKLGPAKVRPVLFLASQNYRINVYRNLLNKLNAHQVILVVVSKTQPLDRILALYEEGQRIFGENRVQELLQKAKNLPQDIQWHLIGHLQTNKVKQIIPFVSLIQSVDSPRLLAEINKQAQNAGRVVDCLLQFHIAQETSKYGFSKAEAVDLLESQVFAEMTNVRLCGVMGMATFSDDMELVRTEFRQLHHIFTDLKAQCFTDAPHFKEVSMGMSSDWEIAVQEGSTMVRVGSLLFGPRN